MSESLWDTKWIRPENVFANILTNVWMDTNSFFVDNKKCECHISNSAV